MKTLQNSSSSHLLCITPATATMMNQSYPPDKSACNSPHPSSYSMISMPLKDPLINHLNETHHISLLSLLRLYIYPNPTISSSANASQHYGKSNGSRHRAIQAILHFSGPGDSKLMFRLIHFWETCNNSKVGILIGTKMVISQKDMIAYHEHAGEASNSHPPMLDAVSNEFWEHKIVRKSNGTDIYRLQRNVKKRDINLIALRLKLNSSLASSWRRRLGVVIGVVEGMFYLFEQWPEIIFDLNASNVLIRNLKPGEEQEDPERRVVDENMKIEERTLGKIKQVITLGLMFTDKSPSNQIKLLRRFMTWCFFV
ncbi:LOW QUALITY PROTEIN: hypothetical protein HID58_041215 [Brassica napus]|uniref:Uncharacterized protein n=1 Tax=Brassica napus TaxID=3708 RepID=A0ABQ8BA77_BRANA|nr:LOW QUALITY PROTEIN: hypothetical protein HID58_041215 [Brassica napus]